MNKASPIMFKNCRHGPLLYLRGDQYIGRSLELYGEFSELEADLFVQIVRAGDVIVEVGANIGAHTVHLAQLAGPGGLVHAFEPQRVIFQMLCANVALNGLLNVHAHHAGAGSSHAQLQVPLQDYAAVGNFGAMSLLPTAPAGSETVPVLALDSMDLPALKLLKIDVEGMEYEVLSGARQTIARHRPFLYVENDREDKSAALITLIDELGYRMFWHLPALYNPANFAANEENIFPGIVSVNMLCIPKESTLSIAGFRPVSGPDDWWKKAAPASPAATDE
jgi:FkbM family methyltransferase